MDATEIKVSRRSLSDPIGFFSGSGQLKSMLRKLATNAFYSIESSPSIRHAEASMKFFVWLCSEDNLTFADQAVNVPLPGTPPVLGFLHCFVC